MATQKQRKLIALAVAVYIPLALLIGFVLAGYLFFLFNKKLPSQFDPLLFWHCWTSYSTDHDLHKKLIGAAIAAAVIVYCLPLMVIGAILGRQRSLYGSARFANAVDIRNAGLHAEKGIILGKHHGHYLVLGGETFVLVAAPTRSGKGVSVVIPNLLNWPDSVICLDLKYENFLYTSGFRQRSGQAVFLFAPFSEAGETHRWNPLGFIRRGTEFVVDDIQSIGFDLYPLTGDPKTDYWNGLARDLFLGVALYVAETAELPFSLGEVFRQGVGAGKTPEEHFKSLIAAREQSAQPLSPHCVRELRRYCAAAASSNVGSSIHSTFTQPLSIFGSPFVDAATSACDFDVSQVRRVRMSIYLGVPANKLAASSLLMNMFFAQVINLNTRELPQNDATLTLQCLLLPDEFTALGRINIIAKSVSYMAGFGLRLLPVVQSEAQIRSVYRDDTDNLLNNHDTKIIYAPTEQKDAEAFSKMLGDFTMRVRNVGGSSPSGLAAHGSGSSSHNITQARRELMKPQELRELPAHQCIIAMRGHKPILCEKAVYFDDPVFIDRLKQISPSLNALGKKIPTRAQLESAAFVVRDLSISVPKHAVSLTLQHAADNSKSKADEIDLSALSSTEFVLPPLDDPQNPSEQSLAAVVDDFFSQLPWVAVDTSTAALNESDMETEELDLALLD